MVRFSEKSRTVAGISLLICLTGYAVIGLLVEKLKLYPNLPETAPVTIHEQRISRLRPFLPAAGVVGYVTTVENERIFSSERTFSNVEYLAQYVLTQYTLAPLIVENSPDRPLVVGNFLDGPPPPGFLELHGLVPLKEFGEGLVLFRKDRKK